MMSIKNAEMPALISQSVERGVMSPPSLGRVALAGASLNAGSIARVAAGLGPRIMFSPDEPAAPPAGEPPLAAPPAPPAGDPPAGDPPPAAAQRPDWIAENFWDAEKGEIKGADLKTHLDELSAFRAAQESKLAAVPEKPDGYELKLPADLKFAEGEGFELNPDDPMLAFGRTVAHSMGLDQSGFEQLVGLYAQREIAQAKEIQEAIGRQIEALGPKGAERQGAVKTFLAAKLGPDAPTIFEPVLMLKNGVEAMERLMRVASSGGMSGFSQTGREGGKTAPSEEEYAAMSPAEKLVSARRAQAGAR